jgi:23S rRNA pseudouridine1911/1915/1917 synthase
MLRLSHPETQETSDVTELDISGPIHSPAHLHPRAIRLRVVVPRHLHNKTIDDVLAWRIPRLGALRGLSVLRAGDVRSASGAFASGDRVATGDEVYLWRMPPSGDDFPADEPRIIHEDDTLLVVDKPGDLAIHPTARYFARTLTQWFERTGRAANPAHRIDRETSGVLVAIKRGHIDIERKWKSAFAQGGVHKEYLAVVAGELHAAQHIDAPLALAGERGLVRIRMVVDVDGQHAVTDVEPVEHGAGRTLVRCVPRTGRQHQIRAHLAHIGHPIVGDKLYQMGDDWFDKFTRAALTSTERDALPSPTHALHAARLRCDAFDADFACPLPAAMSSLLLG